MKRLLMVSFALCTSAHAVTISGDPAKALFQALIQADLQTTDITAPDPDFPGTLDIVDQQVSVTKLNCSLDRDQMGFPLGTCTLVDVMDHQVTVGSAAAVQIEGALPSAFTDSGLGHFKGTAQTVSCEIDTRRQVDNAGTPFMQCILQ